MKQKPKAKPNKRPTSFTGTKEDQSNPSESSPVESANLNENGFYLKRKPSMTSEQKSEEQDFAEEIKEFLDSKVKPLIETKEDTVITNQN